MKKFFRPYNIWITVLMLFAGISGSHAQHISVKAGLDTNAILIGDQVNLSFEVQKDKNYVIDFPLLSDTITKGIEILNTSPVDTAQGDEGRTVLTQEVLITSFDSGKYILPPLPFTWRNNDKSDTLYSSPVELTVYTVPVDTTEEIKPIKMPMEAPVTFAEIWPYFLMGILVLVIGLFVYWYIKRRKANKPVFRIEKPKEPAHRVALRDLDKLSEEKLWQKNEIKLFYTRLTNIIRKYLEERFGVYAMEETTGEIMRDIKKGYVDDQQLQSVLYELLSLADMVKFAKNIPLPDENEKLMRHAYDFVIKTKMEKTENGDDNNENEEGERS
jgi:hypothetical protein